MSTLLIYVVTTAVSSVCGPDTPLCAILGSIAGGVAGSVVADSLDEEIEEFTRWQIN